MPIPLWSTITLATELLVTLSVLYIFYKSYRTGRFPNILASITVAYEVIFNITYMASRELGHKNPSALEPSGVILLAIFHGIFSLVMFIALLVFLGIAWRAYRKGTNFFALHPKITISFIILWLIAVITGFAFYYVSYLV